MNQPSAPITIERLTRYDLADATAIGKLLPHLSESLPDTPVTEQRLRDIIESPLHDQFVARDRTGTIVGICTLSITMNLVRGRIGQLEDFVVDSTARAMGVGSGLWQEMLAWCHEKGASRLTFTSNPARTAAHTFYLKHGATIKDTCVFVKVIDETAG